MSGRTQHYLPQFLQRPFSHRENNGYFYVHVYEKSTQYSPNTAGVGAKRDFYSSPEDPKADENITAAEIFIASTINKIIGSEELPIGQDTARIFSSLSLRTLKMRKAMSELAPDMISALRTKAIEEGWALEAMQKQFDDQQWINRTIEEQIKKDAGKMDRNKRATLKVRLKVTLKREYEENKEKWLKDLRLLTDTAMSSLESQAAKIADDAFAKVFADPAGLVKRDLLFSEFHYTLIKDEPGNFLLGDCAVTALDTNFKPRLAMGDVDDEVTLSQVFLPISPHLVIRGTRQCYAPLHTVREINENSVALSNSFFISLHSSSDEIERLRPLIGSVSSPIVSLEELLVF